MVLESLTSYLYDSRDTLPPYPIPHLPIPLPIYLPTTHTGSKAIKPLLLSIVVCRWIVACVDRSVVSFG